MKSKHDGWTPEEQVETQEQITPELEAARPDAEAVPCSAWLGELRAALALAREARDRAIEIGEYASAKYWQGYLDGAEKAVSEERHHSPNNEAQR